MTISNLRGAAGLFLPALALAALAALSGCSEMKSYHAICQPDNLTGANRTAILAQVQRHYTLDPEDNEIGSFATWAPFVHMRTGSNLLCSGNAAEDLPATVIERSPLEQWLLAKEYFSIGPLASVFVQWKRAFFDMQGTNFGYTRTRLVLYGILWMDHRSKEGLGGGDRTSVAGPLWGAFGVQHEEHPETAATYLRFLWVPIPVARD